jgi:threonine/homoserine/homoserine lactone efflux protein
VALLTVLGMTLVAGCVQLPLLALGVATLVRSSPIAFDLLRWGGAGYLVWLGARLLFRRRPGAPPPTAFRPALASIGEGLVANLTNPQPLIFMLAFLPQFVDPARGSVMAQFLLLGATQKATGFLLLGATALASGSLGDWLARRPAILVWQQRLAGTILMLLGLRLLFLGGNNRG